MPALRLALCTRLGRSVACASLDEVDRRLHERSRFFGIAFRFACKSRHGVRIAQSNKVATAARLPTTLTAQQRAADTCTACDSDPVPPYRRHGLAGKPGGNRGMLAPAPRAPCPDAPYPTPIGTFERARGPESAIGGPTDTRAIPIPMGSTETQEGPHDNTHAPPAYTLAPFLTHFAYALLIG